MLLMDAATFDALEKPATARVAAFDAWFDYGVALARAKGNPDAEYARLAEGYNSANDAFTAVIPDKNPLPLRWARDDQEIALLESGGPEFAALHALAVSAYKTQYGHPPQSAAQISGPRGRWSCHSHNLPAVGHFKPVGWSRMPRS